MKKLLESVNMNWEFNAENNDGRCAICDEKKELDHKMQILNTLQENTSFEICSDCAVRLGAKLSDRVMGVFREHQ